MDCNAIRELLPDFALGALSGDEEAAVRAHLDECDAHPEAVALRAAALGLAVGVTEREAPAGARDRLMAALAAADAPDEVAAPAPGQIVKPLRIWLERANRHAGQLAAVLALVVVGLVVWNVVLQVGDSRDTSLSRFQAEIEGVTGTALHLADEERAVLDFMGLQALPDDQEYQVWVIGNGDPQGAGTLRVSSEGRASIVVATPPGIGVIAVTVEPAGGSPLPTSDPILVTEF